ncbi:MAG: hypothetical protein ACR2OO_09640 [Thermomicrobiales bacterium]
MDESLAAGPDFFTWSDLRIVLIGESTSDGWVLARGWRRNDELSDVRRWSFSSERRFVGQVRRLVRDATDDQRLADHVAQLASLWIGAHGRDTPAAPAADR